MNYWEFALQPCRYTDDFYHIGAETAPCWLLKSTEGYILIDTGLPKTLYLIMENLRKIGVDYRDIKHIIHTHGHIDHIGGTRALVALTGAKTYIGYGDEKTVRGEDELQWTNEFQMPFEEAFIPDYVVQDGGKIKIGDKEIMFIGTPGHTAGTMSLFFNVKEKGKEYRAGMFGGGLLSMSGDYLRKYGLPFSLREDFIKSIDKVYNERVEVHVGNHLGDNKHREKIKRIGESENPFLDGSTWKWFLDKRRDEALDFFQKDL